MKGLVLTETPARRLIQELRVSKQAHIEQSHRLKAGSVEKAYPAIRDHGAVLAMRTWLAEIDTMLKRSREVMDRLPDGETSRVVVSELSGYARRAANVIRLSVSE